MPTTRFQPGDKVRVKFGVLQQTCGLVRGSTYTVAHVDDFGRIQVRGLFPYFSAARFELVERTTAMPCYSLKDGEGDWWVYTTEDPAAEGRWHLVNDPAVTREGSESGAQEIIEVWGIDTEESLDMAAQVASDAALADLRARLSEPETYCLKDGEGDWHFSEESAEGPYLMVGGDGYTDRPYELIADRWGIDTAPLPTMKGAEPTHVEVDEVQSWQPYSAVRIVDTPAPFTPGDRVEYVGGGVVQTPRLVGETGTAEFTEPDSVYVEWDNGLSPRGVLAKNLRKVETKPEVEPVLAAWESELIAANTPAPLQPGDAVDQRIDAWDRIADHPLFRPCYAEERPLIDAMMAKLDRIHIEGASPAHPDEPTALGAVVHCEEGSVFVRVDAYGRKPWMRSGFDERRSWDEIPAVERIEGVN